MTNRNNKTKEREREGKKKIYQKKLSKKIKNLIAVKN